MQNRIRNLLSHHFDYQCKTIVGARMASIVRDPNGRKRILFFNADGNRKVIRLGKMSQRQAEAVKLRSGPCVP